MKELKDFAPTLDLSDSEVYGRLVVAGQDIGSGVHGTHLNNSLKDLQGLGIDAVTLTGGAESESNGEHLFTVDLGVSGSSALSDVVDAGLPTFSKGDVGLITDVNTLLGGTDNDYVALGTAGITEIELNDLNGALNQYTVDGNIDNAFANNALLSPALS